MKLVIATLAASLSLATAASAMVGPYERAVNLPEINAALFTGGETVPAAVQGLSTSPEAVWNDGTVTVTVLPGGGTDQFGVDAR